MGRIESHHYLATKLQGNTAACQIVPLSEIVPCGIIIFREATKTVKRLKIENKKGNCSR